MPLPESWRLEYLKALGIDSYFPRVQLPGAPASVIVGITPDRDVPPEPVATAAPAPAAKPAASAPRPAPAPAPKADVTPATPEPAPAAPRSAPREEIRLQLLCIRASADLAVINAMPHMGPGRLSAAHQALLVNLLGACGIAGAEIQVEDKPFNWPMVTGLHVDNSRRAATAALNAYLQQKRTDWGFSKLLVLGEEVVRRLYSPDDGEAALVPPLDKGLGQVLYTRSLDEMLQRPVLKKEAWARIRSLLP